ncbi:MAG: hypothetical protein K1X94_11405 [Sandaracinaceae bacterium]|nr:hypothetical protein [Sandaracinaceae bacterium]
MLSRWRAHAAAHLAARTALVVRAVSRGLPLVCAAMLAWQASGVEAQLRATDLPAVRALDQRAAPSPVRAPRPLGELGPFRGITVGPIENSQQPGRGYGTVYSEALLDHLVRMGVTWISVTPFGRIWSLSSTEIYMDFEAPYEVSREGLRTMIAQAHARGIRVLVIPHLWVWSEVGWRGEIDFPDAEGWRDYQASYRAFVLAWAMDAAAAGADAFSIGVECKSWSGRFGPFWTRLIAEVRSVYPGLLTYSANWDEAEDVLFWDQLDLIGVNAFYPLAPENDASFETYEAGAARIADQVETLARVLDMPVLFVEVGYTTRENAAVEPWLWPDGMSDVAYSEEEQARALEASFRGFVPRDWFAGFFLWRYYANLDDVSQEAIWGFSTHGKMGEPMLTSVFGARFGQEHDPLEDLVFPEPEPLDRTAAWWRSTVID